MLVYASARETQIGLTGMNGHMELKTLIGTMKIISYESIDGAQQWVQANEGTEEGG